MKHISRSICLLNNPSPQSCSGKKALQETNIHACNIQYIEWCINKCWFSYLIYFREQPTLVRCSSSQLPLNFFGIILCTMLRQINKSFRMYTRFFFISPVLRLRYCGGWMSVIRVKENRFFAGPDRFIELKTDLFENFCWKIGPRKFSLWPKFPVNRWVHLVKTDKYLVKCQAVYCPYYVIQLSPVLGPCDVKFDK